MQAIIFAFPHSTNSLHFVGFSMHLSLFLKSSRGLDLNFAFNACVFFLSRFNSSMRNCFSDFFVSEKRNFYFFVYRNCDELKAKRLDYMNFFHFLPICRLSQVFQSEKPPQKLDQFRITNIFFLASQFHLEFMVFLSNEHLYHFRFKAIHTRRASVYTRKANRRTVIFVTDKMLLNN